MNEGCHLLAECPSFPRLPLTDMAVPVQAASGALFLNSSRVTVYDSFFDRNRGEHTLQDLWRAASGALHVCGLVICSSIVTITTLWNLYVLLPSPAVIASLSPDCSVHHAMQASKQAVSLPLARPACS